MLPLPAVETISPPANPGRRRKPPAADAPIGGGWIKVHRSLGTHPRFTDPDWVSVWLHLLLSATHQTRKMNFDGKIIELQPGQLITGRFAIAKATGVEPSKVKRILATMKSDQQIDQLPGAKGSVFTVLNWSAYQNSDQQHGQRVTSDRPASDQPLTTNKKGRTEKQENEITGEARPLIDDAISEALKIGLTASEAEKFHSYYQAHGWTFSNGRPVVDWKAALRLWKKRFEGMS